jgi:hypothetical protein
MMLPIRRPVRPQPGPLRERTESDNDKRPDCVWLSVRHKRSRAPAPARSKLRARGPAMAAAKN